MAKGGTEFIHHVVGVRLRLTGDGNLQHRLSSLDNIRQTTLMPIVMTPTTPIEPFRMTNFLSQRIRYELFTTELDETFLIRRIIIYGKPSATEYPG